MFYDVENTNTYFSKRLAKVLGKAVVENRICYTQINVRQHMTKYLYGDS